MNHSGVVEASEIRAKYDVTQHPDVISGKSSPDEVLAEFLATFEDTNTKDGQVTQEEFEQYYHNISASIDEDDYFELMIRNAWHISGGQGQCANTANRRVLVTHADGTQTVEEVKDDLGVTSTQTASRLKQQGLNVKKIETSGVLDKTTQRGASKASTRKKKPPTRVQKGALAQARALRKNKLF